MTAAARQGHDGAAAAATAAAYAFTLKMMPGSECDGGKCELHFNCLPVSEAGWRAQESGGSLCRQN